MEEGKGERDFTSMSVDAASEILDVVQPPLFGRGNKRFLVP